MKRFFIFIFFTSIHNVYAQADSTDKVLVATSEKAMYQLFEHLIDRRRQSDYYGSHYKRYDVKNNFFASYRGEIESTDTLMIAKKYGEFNEAGEFEYWNDYTASLSNKMPTSFYEKLYEYLAKLIEGENIYVKNQAHDAMILVGRILVRRCQSVVSDKADSLETMSLIERSLLSRIIDGQDFYSVYYYYENYGKEFITDRIREALVEALESPYYPEYYLDFYMSRQDTSILDITDIPEEFIKNPPSSPSIEQEPNYHRLYRFLHYKELAEYKYGGISPGKAYLEDRKNGYSDKGYMDINAIGMYAYKSRDKLLIKHLEEFRKKHPDYPFTRGALPPSSE